MYGKFSMRYDLGGGIIIKTENAAKPKGQASKFLQEILYELPHVPETLDYGCGKLRYYDSLLERTDALTLVDSEIQLSRLQTIGVDYASIRDVGRHSNRVTICNESEFAGLNRTFDRAFCINVLSAIPFYARRREVLSNILEKLNFGGACLFVVQYRNSDFSRMSKLSSAMKWRDGFVIDSLRGYSFYGLIRPERLVRMVLAAGFRVEGLFLNEGSAYLWGLKNGARGRSTRSREAF
jgi:hypothetical protein